MSPDLRMDSPSAHESPTAIYFSLSPPLQTHSECGKPALSIGCQPRWISSTKSAQQQHNLASTMPKITISCHKRPSINQSILRESTSSIHPPLSLNCGSLDEVFGAQLLTHSLTQSLTHAITHALIEPLPHVAVLAFDRTEEDVKFVCHAAGRYPKFSGNGTWELERTWTRMDPRCRRSRGKGRMHELDAAAPRRRSWQRASSSSQLIAESDSCIDSLID